MTTEEILAAMQLRIEALEVRVTVLEVQVKVLGATPVTWDK